jgi:hypothetical protein
MTAAGASFLSANAQTTAAMPPELAIGRGQEATRSEVEIEAMTRSSERQLFWFSIETTRTRDATDASAARMPHFDTL